MHFRTLGVPVCIGVGATFDFFRDPIQSAAITPRQQWTRWFFRLWKSPRLSPIRMAKDCWVFGIGLLRQWWQFQSRAHDNWKRSVSKTVRSDIHTQSIRLPESIDLVTVRDDTMLVDQLLADGRHCLLEAADVQSIDSTGVGMLIGLQRRIRATGRQLVLLAPSVPLTQALEVMHLKNFFDSAPDLNSAQELIALRTRERAGAVTPSDAAPSSPLLWQGEITAANADAVWELTQIHLMTPPGRRELIVDMTAVRFIDSSGAGVMLRARKFAQQHSIKLKFTGVHDDVRNVLRISRLEEFLLR